MDRIISYPYHSHGNHRARSSPFLPSPVPVVVPLRLVSVRPAGRQRRPARPPGRPGRFRFQPVRRRRAIEPLARPGHPDAGERQGTHRPPEPAQATARRDQGRQGGAARRYSCPHSRYRRKPGKTPGWAGRPRGALGGAVRAGARGTHGGPARLAPMADVVRRLPDRPGHLGRAGARHALGLAPFRAAPGARRDAVAPLAAARLAVAGGPAIGAL